MRLGLNFSWRQRMLADAAVAAYSEWRGECAAGRASYRQWVGARREEERSAFTDYRSALDREEHAAKRYAKLMRRAGHLVRIGDLRLVDGGVVNNTPISHAVELGAELVYVLPTGEPSNRRLDSTPKTALDAAIHVVQLLVDSRLEADIARYSPAAELVVLPAPNPTGVQPTSFEHSDRLMLGARFVGRAALARQTVVTPLRLAG